MRETIKRALKSEDFWSIVLMMIAVACLVLATPAAAQDQCHPRAVLMEQLADRWGEALISIALTPSGQLVETWANTETGTWTLTVTPPGGLTCVIGAGQAFQVLQTTAAADTAL